jgi:hypothetical protein
MTLKKKFNSAARIIDTDRILSEPGHCRNCKAELSEKTLVEPQGGIEIETMLGVR